MALARFRALVIDAVDPERTGRFWASALGLEAEPVPTGFKLSGPTPEHTVWVDRVPEEKTVKNRVHWDGKVPDQAAVDALEAHGATVLRRPDDEISWTVMADPEGNEFCVLVLA